MTERLWKTSWTRPDAVLFFGEAAVVALESLAPFDSPLRAVRLGPFAWVETSVLGTGQEQRLYFLVDDGWQELARGEDALMLAVERARPTDDDFHFVLDATARLTPWHVVTEGSDEHEPPHSEGGSIAFTAIVPRARSQGTLIRVVIDTETCAVRVSVIK